MEITKKQKQIIELSCIGVGIVGITAIGYYYYLKPKDELGYNEVENVRLPKIKGDSRWQDIDARYEDLDNTNDRIQRRNRFTVYTKNGFKDNSSKVQKRFKVLEKEESVIARTGRFRTSGER